MYFVMANSDANSDRPRRRVDEEPFLHDVSFFTGARISRVLPGPLEFTLTPWRRDAPAHAPVKDRAPVMPATLGTRIPLFRDDLLASLRNCGVDNLEVYAAAVRDPDDGSRHLNYKATNILGLVPAAELLAADLAGDVAGLQRLLMFRLAEAVTVVMVHERVRTHLQQAGFDDLSFEAPLHIAVS
jgi:hypothetical protein